MTVEFRPLSALGEVVSDWDDLSRRSLERNVFFESSFALPAAQHLNEGRNAAAALVWGDQGGERVLLGLFPLLTPKITLAPARVWRPPLFGRGEPLVDRDHGPRVLEAFLAALARRAPALVIPSLSRHGALAATLQTAAAASGRSLRFLDEHARAVLPAPTGATASQGPSGKKGKELRRQLRRLGDGATVSFREAADPETVREAVEVFLALEASGWKGDRRTALIQNPGSAAFVRTMTRSLAREGRCRVHLLLVGERPLAAGIVLTSGDRAFFWKIAYDEAFARFSPGVQLTLHLTGVLAGTPGLVTDSCADADHPMIDHLWPERMRVADALVFTRPGSSSGGQLAAAYEHARRRLRAAAKRGYLSLRSSMGGR